MRASSSSSSLAALALAVVALALLSLAAVSPVAARLPPHLSQSSQSQWTYHDYATPLVPYNASLAKELLHLCGAAYCPPSTVEQWSCSFCSKVTGFTPYGVAYNKTTDILAVVGYKNDTNSIIVSYRGTALLSIVDWLTDLNFWAVSALCDQCEVHRGFLGAYLSVRERTLQLVKQITDIYPDAKIVITGHSLGGAMALLASVDFALNQQLPAASALYTFGAPRVGNPAFIQQWNKLYGQAEAYRVTHGADPVPHVPPREWKFQHHATEIYYDPLNSGYRVCASSGEDAKCANQWLLALDAGAHVTYLGLEFVAEYLKCTL